MVARFENQLGGDYFSGKDGPVLGSVKRYLDLGQLLALVYSNIGHGGGTSSSAPPCYVGR